jgi:endonuclease-3
MIKNLGKKKKQAEQIIAHLKILLPHAKIALNYSTPFELLIAVILSAQTTDIQVNKITAVLFNRYKTLDDYVNADLLEFESYVKSANFYHNKAKNILRTAKMIKEKFNGKVPDTMEDLLTLSGVARKTANVILGNIYHKYEGIVVDTHVKRLTHIWGLTDQTDPVKIEKELMEIIPKKDWYIFSYLAIDYGRAYCSARPHNHTECPISKLTF